MAPTEIIPDSTNHERRSRFAQFWPSYVHDHRHPMNRRLHVIGTGASFVFMGLAAVRENPVFILLALVTGYGFAWSGHFFVDGNRPATFRAPFLSLLGDWRLFYLTVNGKITAELERLSALKAESVQRRDST